MANDRLSQALKEAYAAAPAGEVALNTIEIWHPSFTTPIRVVNDYNDLTARIEATAPRDASTDQLFVSYPFRFQPPPQAERGLPEAILEIDNVTREITGYLEDAVMDPQPIEVIWRPYLSTAPLSGPQMDPPLLLHMTDITVDAFRIQGRCTFANFTQRSFPSELYKIDDFPGLMQ